VPFPTALVADYSGRVNTTGIASREARRIGTTADAASPDAVVVEEPLEIRLGSETVAITMRTPVEDDQLALGFLFGEGIVADANQVEQVAYCGRPADEGYGNSIRVVLRPDSKVVAERLLASRRWTVTTSACGVCGRQSIDDLLARCPVLPKGPPVRSEVVVRCIDRLRDLQTNFAKTGGIHAAAVFDTHGEVIVCCEDIGRHNAVDKVVGHLLQRGLVGREARDRSKPGEPAVLAVSGRSSFEIVQKAAVARIPVIASVSAASSLAIDVAEACGVTLAAFVRNGSLNAYAHASRLGA
jgi:FdhD protein